MKRKKVGDLNFFELLGISVNASDEQVERAYLKLTSMYSDGSITVYGALTQNDRIWILNQIRLAYETLISPDNRNEYAVGITVENANSATANQRIGAHEEDSPIDTANKTTAPDAWDDPQPGSCTQNAGDDCARISGSDLRNIRLAKGLSLKNVADITKIKKSYLEALERDDFDRFPATVFIKGFLKSYAKALGLNPNEISQKYFDKT